MTTSLSEIPLTNINGAGTDPGVCRGKVLLVVNATD